MFGDLIVWYLFLGGSGAGLLVVLSSLDILRWIHLRSLSGTHSHWSEYLSRRFFTRGYLITLAALGLGAACLLVDLGHPERFYYVLTHPTASLLTFGSYVLVAAMICAALLAAVALFDLVRVPGIFVRCLEILSLAAGTCTMVYTGLFLADIDFVALWHNPILPLLFSASAASAGAIAACGLALLESDGLPTPLVKLLARTDLGAVLAEALCIGAYLAVAIAQGDVSAAISFLTGVNAPLLWVGFVGLGLALPLAIEVAYTRIGGTALLALAVPCVLIGGYILRYCVVNVPLA